MQYAANNAARCVSDAFLQHLAIPAEAILRPVFNELTYNLESFNPAFTSCLLMVSLCR